MIKLRIPTEHPYAFVEVDVEIEDNQNIKQAYDEIHELMNPKQGLNAKICPNTGFYSYLVELFNGNIEAWGGVEDYNEFYRNYKYDKPATEQDVVQAIKRYSKRIKSND